MVKYSEIMNVREEEISRIIEQLSKRTDGFENPKIILVGGYALRAFTSLSLLGYSEPLQYRLYRSPLGNFPCSLRIFKMIE